jgi:hypothetical protein
MWLRQQVELYRKLKLTPVKVQMLRKLGESCSLKLCHSLFGGRQGLQQAVDRGTVHTSGCFWCLVFGVTPKVQD